VAVTVTLELGQMRAAAMRGLDRWIEGRRRKRGTTYGYRGDALVEDIGGAFGEQAAALYFDRCPNDSLETDKSEGDVAGVGVRWTRHATGRLIVHPDDPDDRLMLLATGWPPQMTLHGVMWARDAKRPEWWDDGQPGRFAYFVPQSALVDITDRGIISEMVG
jgi:hypothetical protein